MLVNHVRERIFSFFSDLEFEEKRHLYRLKESGIFLPSVSKLIERHVKKINFEEILPFSAAKASREEGKEITPDELRVRWHSKRDLRCAIGTNTHHFLEHYTGHQTASTGWERAGVKFFQDHVEEYDILFREIRMYSRKYLYAGTDDLVLIHRETGELIIGDYKTNEDLFKNYKGKRLLSPFDSLEESPFNKYQLQLSYYQIMLEEAGLSIKDRWLIYLREDGTYSKYDLWDFTPDLRELLSKEKVAA